MVFVNFSAHRATLKNRVMYSECDTLYIYVFINKSFLSFHQESYVGQIVPSQCLAQPMAMSLAVVRSWGEQAVSIMGQTSRCCMVCLMLQSQVSCSLENPHFNMFTLDRPTCVRNRLSAFQVVQRFSALLGGVRQH